MSKYRCALTRLIHNSHEPMWFINYHGNEISSTMYSDDINRVVQINDELANEYRRLSKLSTMPLITEDLIAKFHRHQMMSTHVNMWVSNGIRRK